ncbi:hypothetical protein QVD17_36829 [Tagetes erecta]|uniref:MRG domain-containing protein n=1 Tax=Tagetes erecta TaxID=13708 RepID=A0AAD8JVH0_TARER|nr:hypothetical protein QVD17_36829 [Tagetes erecta]
MSVTKSRSNRYKALQGIKQEAEEVMKKMQTQRHRKARNQKEAGDETWAMATSNTKDDADNSSANRRRANSNTKFFSDGEKVLAYHGPRIYEAKVLKSEIRKNEWKYYVHYLGWSKTKGVEGKAIGISRLQKHHEISVYGVSLSTLELKFLAHEPDLGFLVCVFTIDGSLPLEYIQISAIHFTCWDEWVGAERLMKTTEENIRKQQALDKKQGVEPKSARSNQTKSIKANDSKVDKEKAKSNGAKGKKRKHTSSDEKENASVGKLVDIEIPQTLKQQLVDDWGFVNEQNNLVKLPRSPNIDDILKLYLEYRSKKEDMTEEILKGLRCYFDRALPVILLYDKERPQYREYIKNDVSPSSIYGAEHLLRLFVKLPELLPYVNIEEELLISLQQKFLDFLKFLQKKQSSFFLSSYDG